MNYMTKKYVKIIIGVFLCIVLFLKNGIMVEADSENEIITSIVDAQNEYEDWLNCEMVFSMYLYDVDGLGYAEIYNVIDCNGVEHGYVILTSTGQILEYSKNINPYERAIDINEFNVENNNCLYINGCYYVEINEELIQFNSLGEVLVSENSDNISLYGYVGGNISPQLQNGHNCIVAAISNLIWYYGNNGYSSLIAGKTFTTIKNEVNTIINSYGGYANAYIPSTLSTYLGSRYSSSTPISYPTFAQVQSEINQGYPCLLGFAKGVDSYSETVGHMTLCVGWVKISSSYYTCVIDGHSTNTVTKAWASYNDYCCKVRLN